ncbi:hypothetical protein NGM99_17115 [Mesorhizobium sp. RP14(2022)]|uniref:Uncharacterized protein n=1 Tax=Mesorhizobium liriopis TaxID=2953882 RepID=A0ABT1C9J4_9HYPH|nr:hypothetical protein [Mesorhizobium liriopis]MCO6051507.1 hypothetical protein [Mesorhizobium liriopis]
MNETARPFTEDDLNVLRTAAVSILAHREAMPGDTALRRFHRERMLSDAEVWLTAAENPSTWEAMEEEMFAREREIMRRHDVTP